MDLTRSSSSRRPTVLSDLPGRPLPTHLEPPCFLITATPGPKPLCFLEGSVPTTVACPEHPHLIACSGCAFPSSASAVHGVPHRRSRGGVELWPGTVPLLCRRGVSHGSQTPDVGPVLPPRGAEAGRGDPTSSDSKGSGPPAPPSEGPAAPLQRERAVWTCPRATQTVPLGCADTVSTRTHSWGLGLPTRQTAASSGSSFWKVPRPEQRAPWGLCTCAST